MANFDPASRTLTAKLVYYGPALSGKTTNLLSLHDRLDPGAAGELMVFDTRGDRTLFFDLVPLRFRAASGLTLRLKVFTVPGQVAHDATRKAVLSRTDAVVFVADSQATQARNNFESFRNLEESARRMGLDFDRLPLVVQYNKRDLPDALGEEELRARWQLAGVPLVLASALRGEGVVETFQAVLGAVHGPLEAAHGLRTRWGVGASDLTIGLLGPQVRL